VRKIIRRAVRDGYELGLTEPVLNELTGLVDRAHGGAYPELVENRKQIQALTLQEERGFRQIYTQGVARFEEWFEAATDGRHGDPAAGRGSRSRSAVSCRSSRASGEAVFELHDTHGFPADISRALVYDHGFAIDEEALEAADGAQRERARQSSQLSGDVFAGGFVSELKAKKVPPTQF
jgi:alanyl-tRNA synthetase